MSSTAAHSDLLQGRSDQKASFLAQKVEFLHGLLAPRNPNNQWKQRESEARKIVGAAVDELIAMLSRGKHAWSAIRIEVGEPMPAALLQHMRETIEAADPEALARIEAESIVREREKNQFPSELVSRFRMHVTAGIMAELRADFLKSNGKGAAVKIWRDYDWRTPLPGSERFFREAGMDSRHSNGFLDAFFPNKFVLEIELTSKGWSGQVRYPRGQDGRIEPEIRELKA